MVNINDVYVTVQAIMNKEQRGYVAPIEFNHFARQAQDEIFEAYFYDLPHFKGNPKGMLAAKPADIVKNIQEKIDIFSEIDDCTYANDRFTLPADAYRLGTVYYNDGTTTVQVVELMKSNLQYVLNSKLTAPSVQLPKYIRLDNDLRVYPGSIVTGVEVHYIKTPATPTWGYIMIGDDRQPIYNPASTSSTNFELHASERYVLVEKILQYAGVQLKQADIVQFAGQDESNDNLNKKS